MMIADHEPRKRCVKCGRAIAAADVVLAEHEDERCHECADYCDDPECRHCFRATAV